MGTEKDQKLSHKETARLRDEALRRALNTPPKPHKATKPQSRVNEKIRAKVAKA
jgi:hypothetical protein